MILTKKNTLIVLGMLMSFQLFGQTRICYSYDAGNRPLAAGTMGGLLFSLLAIAFLLPVLILKNKPDEAHLV